LVTTTPFAAAAQDTLPPPRTIAELESRIREVMTRQKVPSLGIALVNRDSVLWVAGLGKLDMASGQDADAGTLYRIGSTSKAFASLLVLMLEQEGKLKLDDPIAKYAPEIRFRNRWEETDPVRIVHLLEHTTGWDDLAFRDYANSDSTPLTLKQGLDFTPRTRTSRWRPGTNVSYCNSGPPVAAYIAEKLEGRTFESLVQDRIFLPLGMTTATYLREPALRERMATLYHADGVTPYPYWHVIQRPAGSINASPMDMARYVQFLLNRGAVNGVQLLPREAIEAMERPRSSGTAKAGLAVGYGLHIGTYVDSGFVWMGHDGGVNGGLTMMSYRPDAGTGFAYMTTSANGEAYGEIGNLVRAYLTLDEATPMPPPAGAMPEVARERAGWYEPDNPRVQGIYFLERVFGLTRVTVDDTALVLKPVLGSPARYLPVAGTLFRQPLEPLATLALTSNPDDGRAAGIEQMGYLLPAEYHRIPAWRAMLEIAVTVLWLAGSVLTLLFALIWIPRKLLGRLKGVKRTGPRLWPLVAVLSVVALVLIVALNTDDLIGLLGVRTGWSMAFTAMTVLFPVAALFGLVSAWRTSGDDAGRGARRFGLLVSVLNVVVACWLVAHGVVGWRTWA
jgi:CubicO group peptidase (beta-lactamase class C family)